ncbi:cysteine proteinase [Auriscalpium vulgare]|uniref:Cysteine proteinase n=1 Tax=Auriscalpium vulgare TaxID=40419 RepID=A0ACB8RMR4_9AGAM|nr:cysteine proteinase [Auriscalpium vulgare]
MDAAATSSNLPAAPRQRTTDLPDIAEPASHSAKVQITEDTDLASLTPAQLYDLNQSAINDLTASDRPLIAPVAPLDVLRAEYERGSQSFVQQIDFLQRQGYQGIRRTRGDGDCFYRSLAFAYIERILASPDRSFAVVQAISTLEAALPMLDAAGYQKMVYEDFYQVLLSLIRRIDEPDMHGQRLTPEVLLEAFQDAEVSNYIVVFLRLLTSAQIRADPDSYAPFLFHPEIGEQMTVHDFCVMFVEAIGKEADHVQVTSLSRALKINVSVAYLDGRSSDGRVDFVQFHNSLNEDEEALALLYRPGHYDLLDKGSIEALSL